MPAMTREQMEATIRRQAAEIGQLRAKVERVLAENAVLQAERDEARADNELLRAENARLRSELEQLRAENAQLRAQMADMKRSMSALVEAIQNSDERLRRLLRREFGAVSERACSDQAYIPEILAAMHALESDTGSGEVVALTPGTPAAASTSTSTSISAPDHGADAEPESPIGRRRRRPANAGGRNPLPADIERRHSTYEPPADHPFLRHATSFTRIGTTAIERWSVGKVDIHIEVLTCPVVRLNLDGGITTQQTLTPPSVIERGQISDDLLVQSAVDKVVDHLPSHRQEQRAARLGAVIPRAKLCRWHIGLATFLGGVAEAIFDEITASQVIGIDDTVHRLQVDDRRVCQQARIWTVSAPVGLYYLFSPTREGAWISDLLSGYRGGVMGDAYAGHRRLLATPAVVALFCWAHVRRKFHESEDRIRRQVMLDLIQKLYAIEAELRTATPAERVFTRSARAKPILDDIKTTLDAWAADSRILPKSGIGIAVNYARKLWLGLERYPTIGHAPIDNNATERAIRPIALHRKNSLFSASEAGAESYATLLTVTRSALLHHLEPVTYLNDIISDLHYGRRSPVELTPAQYARRRNVVGKQAP
jgi:transposase